MSVPLAVGLAVALAAAALLGRAGSRVGTSAPESTSPRRRRDQARTQVDDLERAIRISASFAGDAHQRLRPLLRDVAVSRLRRNGIDLDRDSAAAAELLGPSLHDLVRADRPEPENGFAKGVSSAELDDHLRRLEAL